MYNKNKGEKIEYQLIIDNKLCITFNTSKKRKDIIKKLNNTRNITYITNFSYPWDLEDGIKNKIYFR